MPVSVTHVPAASPAVGTQEDAAGWLESEWRNILQAAQHAVRHEWKRKCADLTHVLAEFLETRAYWDEAIAAHTLALQACRDLADPARIAQASLELSAVSQQIGRHEAALPLAEDAAAIYRSLADRRGEAEALDQIGMAHQRAARSREALAYFNEAGILYRDAADQHGVASMAEPFRNRLLAARALPGGNGPPARRALRYREVGDRRGEAKTLNNLGRMQLYCGYPPGRARRLPEGHWTFSREIGGAQNQAIRYHNIGTVHHYKGNHEEGSGCLPPGARHLPRNRRPPR